MPSKGSFSLPVASFKLARKGVNPGDAELQILDSAESCEANEVKEAEEKLYARGGIQYGQTCSSRFSLVRASIWAVSVVAAALAAAARSSSDESVVPKLSCWERLPSLGWGASMSDPKLASCEACGFMPSLAAATLATC